MCIRDRASARPRAQRAWLQFLTTARSRTPATWTCAIAGRRCSRSSSTSFCLLYTSDAADDM
eukprot:8598670-Prorocentrum_lima.AAC.1